MKGIIPSLVVATALIVSTGVQAVDNKKAPVAKAQFQGNHISFVLPGVAKGGQLTIVGPNQFGLQKNSKFAVPSVNLNDYVRYGVLADGQYNYRLVLPIGKERLFKDHIDNGRGENDSVYAREGVIQDGHFFVVNGQIKHFKDIKEPKFGGIDW